MVCIQLCAAMYFTLCVFSALNWAFVVPRVFQGHIHLLILYNSYFHRNTELNFYFGSSEINRTAEPFKNKCCVCSKVCVVPPCHFCGTKMKFWTKLQI